MEHVGCAFTDADTTDLNAHSGGSCSPHYGATWPRHGVVPLQAAVITDENRARAGAANAIYYASGLPANTEQHIEADFHVKSVAGVETNILARMNTSGTLDCYSGGYNVATGLWILAKIVASVSTTLQSSAATLTVGATYRVRLEVRNNVKQLFVDGVLRCTSADNAITAAGRAGVFLSGTIANTTGIHLDNFSARTIPVTQRQLCGVGL